MNWEQAQRLLHLRKSAQAKAARTGGASPRGESPGLTRATSLCVASGKGGTGKSITTAALSARLAQLGRTLLVDADMGIGNAHILQGVSPDRSFVELVAGTASPREVVAACGPGLDLIAAGSGVSKMAELSPFELHRVAEALEYLETGYDHLLVDSAAGVSNQTVTLAAASDLCLLVTTPAVTAMTDAYAFLKVFVGHCEAVGDPRPLPLLVVNRVASADEGAQVTGRLREVTRKFLGRDLEVLGELPDDRAVFRCTQQRRSVLAGEPNSEVGRALRSLAVELAARLAESPGGGAGARLAAMHGQPPASRRA